MSVSVVPIVVIVSANSDGTEVVSPGFFVVSIVMVPSGNSVGVAVV